MFTITDGKRRISGAIFISGNESLMDAADDTLKYIGVELAYMFAGTFKKFGSTATQSVVRPPEA